MPLPKPDVSNAKVEVAVDRRTILGEGPHWIERTQTLLWVDIFGPSVFLYDPATKTNVEYNLKDQLVKLGVKEDRRSVGVVVPIANDPDRLLIGTGSHIATLNLSNGEVEFKTEFSDGLDYTRFNDGKCDPSGRFWVGSMGREANAQIIDPEAGSLYLVDKGFAVPKSKVEKVSISNGLAWTADRKTMYYIDSIPGVIYAFDFDDESGCLSNKRTLITTSATLGAGAPDGMAIDTLGRLWVAGYNTPGVHCFDPSAPNEPPVTIKLPNAKCFTSCCFGGKNLDELYVTSAGKDDVSDNAGKLFRITNLDATGYPGQEYAG